MKVMNIFEFKFDKNRKTLIRGHNQSFPASVRIVSDVTGKEIDFTQVSYGHPFYDEDGWDGEQMVYVPVNPAACPKVAKMVLHHF